MIDTAIKGTLVGVVAAICLIFAFQTRVPYPQWVMTAMEQPWILVVASLIAVAITPWSPEIAALMLLCIAAVVTDKIIFAREFPQQQARYDTVDVGARDANQAVGASDEELFYGRPLIDTVELDYPIFYGLDHPQSGPAPF